MRHKRPKLQPGQESVWDYPRPPAVESCKRRVRIVFDGEIIAESTRALRVLETSHPPTYYLPPEDIRTESFHPAGSSSVCEYKGRAIYFNLRSENRETACACWCYPAPHSRYNLIKGYFAFYPSRVDACYLDDERVEAQAGDFYGGWISSEIVGPFKGAQGTSHW